MVSDVRWRLQLAPLLTFDFQMGITAFELIWGTWACMHEQPHSPAGSAVDPRV